MLKVNPSGILVDLGILGTPLIAEFYWSGKLLMKIRVCLMGPICHRRNDPAMFWI